jgi:hypothetical protein
MREIKTTMIMPGGGECPDSLLPDDMKTEEVIAELKDQLTLPERSENNQRILYSLVIDQRGMILRPGKSLRESGVEDGDVLRLAASEKWEPETEPAVLPSAPARQSGEIEVLLSVLDLNRTEKVTLALDTPVSEIIRELYDRYSIAERDQYGELSDYRLQSKFNGRFLLPEETLRSASVPNGDRLSLHKYERPGGEYARRW